MMVTSPNDQTARPLERCQSRDRSTGLDNFSANIRRVWGSHPALEAKGFFETMEEVRRSETSKSVAECYFCLSASLVGMLIQSSTCFTEIKSCICMILFRGFGVQECFYPQHQYLVRPSFYFSILDEQSQIRSFLKNSIHLMCMNFTHIYNHTRENRCHYVTNHNNAIFSGNPSKSPAICMFVSPQIGN